MPVFKVRNAADTAFIEIPVGVADHGDLAGLADDDHGIYLLIAGSRAMTGNLSLGTSGIVETGAAAGAILVNDGTKYTGLAVGANWRQLVADSAQSKDVAWVEQHPLIALKAATINNITADNDIQWTTSSLKDAGYTHSTSTDSEQITLVNKGLYRIAYVVVGSVDVAGVAKTSIEVDTGGGFALLDNATQYATIPTVSGRFAITYSHPHAFNAGDIIKIVAGRFSVGQWDLRADDSRMSIEQVRRSD